MDFRYPMDPVPRVIYCDEVSFKPELASAEPFTRSSRFPRRYDIYTDHLDIVTVIGRRVVPLDQIVHITQQSGRAGQFGCRRYISTFSWHVRPFLRRSIFVRAFRECVVYATLNHL